MDRGGTIQRKPLADLHFDAENPRFAGTLSSETDEKEILNLIVSTYGIDDVISSIAMNGYFDAEPLLGVQPTENARVTVIEGNRRLAACLVLAGDPRAQDQRKLSRQFADVEDAEIREVPVAIFSDHSRLLPYLGVRHIAGSQTWDSYAKAAWCAKVLNQNPELTIKRITDMTGDQHRTIQRMVEGYYFVQQLIEENRFLPTNSMKRGRGSNTAYPFSWVYTILGFRSIRDWLGLETPSDKPSGTPVPSDEHLDRAEELVDMMFGNKSREYQSVVADSRQLQDLARAVSQPTLYKLLREGVPLKMAQEEMRSPGERIDAALNRADRALSQVQLTLGSVR